MRSARQPWVSKSKNSPLAAKTHSHIQEMCHMRAVVCFLVHQNHNLPNVLLRLKRIDLQHWSMSDSVGLEKNILNIIRFYYSFAYIMIQIAPCSKDMPSCCPWPPQSWLDPLRVADWATLFEVCFQFVSFTETNSRNRVKTNSYQRVWLWLKLFPWSLIVRNFLYIWT